MFINNHSKRTWHQIFRQFYFKYSGSLMKHLSTLGWPVGRSLYKQRKIKKELVCA